MNEIEIKAFLEELAKRQLSYNEHYLSSLRTYIKEDDFIIIAGRPNHGSDELFKKIFLDIALKELNRIILITPKKSEEDVYKDIFLSESEYPFYNLKCSDISLKEEVIQMCLKDLSTIIPKILKLDLKIFDNYLISVEDISNYIDSCKTNSSVVFINDLQMLSSEKEYVETCKKLKTLTREYNIPIVLLSKDPWVEKRIDKKPRISDLDYQGNISNYANKIYLLHREELYNPDTAKTKILDVYIAKNDNGLSNQLIEMYFDDDLKKVSSLERNW